MEIAGNIIDIHNRNIFKGKISISDGKIETIVACDDVPDRYILPGFVDAHIHIESSMVTPYEFAKIALTHGTIATISDPHEIANVCGIEGINYMIHSAENAGLKFFFGAPSCVPATTFENTGASIDADDIDSLLLRKDIWYLSEMMNYPGVLSKDKEVMKKIASSKKYNKPVDGHAPGLMGNDAIAYISTGISTDHECYMLEEAIHKLNHGMKIIIREGSAAKNFDALHPIIASHPEKVMFCSDDKHPDDLIEGHIDVLVKRSLSLGYDLFDVLKIACVNPVLQYNVPVGLLREGDLADFIVVSDLVDWKVTHTFIEGIALYFDNKVKLKDQKTPILNKFVARQISHKELKSVNDNNIIPVIKAVDGSLITEKSFVEPLVQNGYNCIDTNRDLLKIAVVNRYKNTKPAVGFISNFKLKNCAIASSVAHDSHNIIAVGDDEDLIMRAINLLMESKGGLVAVSPKEYHHIALPIAGLMSDKSVVDVGKQYSDITLFVKNHGCTLIAPFMTLSFMALLVIPKIKISDLGMFDAESFSFY